MEISKSTGEVLSVIRALKVIEALADSGKSSLADISLKVGGTKSTIYRILATLVETGYVQQDSEDYYIPTLKFFQIGMCIYSKVDIVERALPFLQELNAKTKETIHLATRNNNQLIYLYKIESSYNLRVSMQSKVGSNAPEYCTGVGKVMLAFSDDEAIFEYIESCRFTHFTSTTICDKETLRNELLQIRKQGYGFDNEEHEEGVRCVAAPIRDYSGKVIASISISGPTIRLTDEKMQNYIDEVLKQADNISQAMGYHVSC